MKTIILIIMSTIIGLFSGTIIAQKTSEPTIRNYIVLTRNIQQLKPIILAAKSLAEEDGKNFGKFQVVICGKTVVDLKLKEKITSFIEMAEKERVQLIACGFSLNKFKIKKEYIPKQIKVVKNGLLYNFQLQKQGYLSIEL